MDDLSIVCKTSQKQSAERLQINKNVCVFPHMQADKMRGKEKYKTQEVCPNFYVLFLFLMKTQRQSVDFDLFGGKKFKKLMPYSGILGNPDPHCTVQQN